MKKIILLCFSGAVLSTASKAQFTYGPEAGLNISSYAIKNGGVKQDGISVRAGGRFGAVADLSISNNIYIQPGAFYVKNGFKIIQIDAVGDEYSYNFNVNTIEIPVNFLYKFHKEGQNRFFLGVGPYLGVNVGGNIKADLIYGGNTRLLIGSDSLASIKRFDFGIGICGGFQIAKGLFVRAHFQTGVLNLQPLGDMNNTLKNTNYGISFGYLFDSRRAKKHKGHTSIRKGG